MAVDLTYEERLEKLDREVSTLQRMFVEAVEEVRRTPETDDSFDARWIETAERLKNLRGAIHPEDFDKSQFATLATAMLDIRDQLDRLDREEEGKLDVCDNLMILLEQVRHVVRDALDEHVTGVADDAGLVMRDLDEWLPNTPDRTIADLLEIDRRTLSRWRKQAGDPRRSLRIFVRLVAILRHNWDEQGIVAWFDRPRRDLGGRRPATVLLDPNYEDELISAARAGRSQYAS
ncbi:MAG TPA: hypothetical protein VGL68_06940 [Solirubrobacteraceae bacterium]